MESDKLWRCHGQIDLDVSLVPVLIPTSALPIFTILHVAISLAAIVSGFIVLFGMIANERLDGWTAFFLATTVATSLTGFGFPIKGMTPGLAFGVISMVILAAVIYGRYSRHLTGAWRPVYVIGAVFAFYLNFVVLIVQSFQKVGILKTLAPHQTEPPFVAAQIFALVVFISFGTLAVKRFRGFRTPRSLDPQVGQHRDCLIQVFVHGTISDRTTSAKPRPAVPGVSGRS